MTKIGWCAPLAEAAALNSIGYDFIEVPLAPMGLETASGLAAAKAAVAASPLPTSAFNMFLPRDMVVVGEVINQDRIARYLAHAAELMAHGKAGIVVFGSGWARNIPDGFDRQRGEAQFTDMLVQSADALKSTGVTLVIEPLNCKESNIVNSVAEGVHFASLVNRPEIKVLADFYHMDEENEPLDALARHGQWLHHIHLADTGRLNPGSGSYPYPEFIRELNKGGYKGLISVECGSPIEDIRKRASLAFLRGKEWRSGEA